MTTNQVLLGVGLIVALAVRSQVLVSLAVAVILYDAGMSLDLRKLRGHTRRVVVRLILMGVPVTLAFGAVFAVLLLGMSRQAGRDPAAAGGRERLGGRPGPRAPVAGP